jgi:hypothetical protein
MIMNVDDFIAKILEYEKMPTIYKLGKFMNSYRKGKNGKFLECDCSGLIKGTLWGYPYNGKYGNIYPDVNANTIMSTYCYNQSSDFSKISKGEFVWMDGHIGVYIGNGKVCECSPKWENGIQITNLNARNWKKHGYSRWLDYSSNSSGISSKTWDIERIARDVINGKYGNGHETRKRNIGCDDATYQQETN